MSVSNRHVLIVGASGSGKTTAEVRELVIEAKRGDSAIVCVDPHQNSLAATFFAHLCEADLQDRVLYDRLSDLDRVLKWDFLSPSTASHKAERTAENDNRCREFAEVLLRRRGKSSMAETPNIEEWILAALGLYIHQRDRRPLSDIRYAFAFDHPQFDSLMDGCQDEDVRYKFDSVRASNQTPFKAAERVIAGVCSSPAFHYRTAHPQGFAFDRHLDQKGILIVEGGAGGTLSQDAMQTMMGAVILKTFNYLRQRKRERPYVTLSLDEVNNANLIGEAGHEVRALAELRKYGLCMHVLTQRLDFPSASVTDGVLTNCATRKYFQSPEPRTASRLGADLGGSYTTEGTTTRHYRDGTTFDVPSDVANSYADELRNFGVGECYIRRGNKNEKTRNQRLPDPFCVTPDVLETLMEGCRTTVKKRPEYFSPDEHDDPVLPPAQDSGPDDSDGSPPVEDEDSPFGI